ncbi:MAG: hypothetical protein OSB14_09545, partial [Planctomycetota bacterium]|nr:hypothetical protein [Planctomycetota bacterium]
EAAEQNSELEALGEQVSELTAEVLGLTENSESGAQERTQLEGAVAELTKAQEILRTEGEAALEAASSESVRVGEEHTRLEKRWENLRATYRAVKDGESEQRKRANALAEEVGALSKSQALLEEAEAKASQVAEELAVKVAKLSSAESGLKQKVRQLEKQSLESEVKRAALAGAEESSRERVAALELELHKVSQEYTRLRDENLPGMERHIAQLSESNSEYEAAWESQRNGAEAVGLDLDGLLDGLTRVTGLQSEVVELEEANASLNQSSELAFQRVSALEVDIEDYEERVGEADQVERERRGEVEQLVAEIERLETNNDELASVSDHTSQRIVALEAELEEFEAEGLATEESVRVQREEIELLMAQLSDLQGSGTSLTNYELPAVETDSYESDDDASGVPAGHDPEDYEESEVSDGPSWES